MLDRNESFQDLKVQECLQLRVQERGMWVGARMMSAWQPSVADFEPHPKMKSEDNFAVTFLGLSVHLYCIPYFCMCIRACVMCRVCLVCVPFLKA